MQLPSVYLSLEDRIVAIGPLSISPRRIDLGPVVLRLCTKRGMQHEAWRHMAWGADNEQKEPGWGQSIPDELLGIKPRVRHLKAI